MAGLNEESMEGISQLLVRNHSPGESKKAWELAKGIGLRSIKQSACSASREAGIWTQCSAW